jgi:carbonic anhydrase
MKINSFSRLIQGIVLVALAFLGWNLYSGNAPKTSADPVQMLTIGNSRFSHLHPIHPDESKQRLTETAKAQHPMAVVVTCSDSRVSPELIFDQGIGDLFVIRNAGNIITGIDLASIEYAVEHLGIKLVMVMGHERCGAIQAFVSNDHAPSHIKEILDSLAHETEIESIPLSDPNRLDECVVANIKHGVRQLISKSPIIHEKREAGQLRVIGARYDLDDHQVTFIDY